MHRIAILAAMLALSACAETVHNVPVDVTRFHLGTPIANSAVRVEPLTGYAGISPEDRFYADAVSAEMGRLGFTPVDDPASPLVAAFSYKHNSHGFVRKPPAVTIGLGGGSYGGGVGVGAGTSFGIGGGRAEVIGTELSVQLRRRSDNTIVWEGKAVSEGLGGAKGEPAGETAHRLAAALFKDFPGESGITITVK